MTNHKHLIIGSEGNKLSDIVRDLKRYTFEKLHIAIASYQKESRREWIIWMMEAAAATKSEEAKFQLWQPESHPVEIRTGKVAQQK